jgi:Lyzozyme M1 (1,4-beta-N-acetylmuramidase)
MRKRSLVAALLTACMAGVSAGCTSSSGIDALDLKASAKVDTTTTTGSVRPLTPMAAVPAAVIAEAPAAAADTELGFAATKPENPVQTALLKAESGNVVATPQAEPAPRKGGRVRVYKARFSDAKPIDFGRASPRPFAVHGVDVSRWQGDIDWVKLRNQGANFAFIKATDGGDHLDPNFRTNWRESAKAGVARGAYHFFYWCRSGSSQADWFIRNVPKEKGALPPVIDVEYNHLSSCKKRLSPETVREKMKAFMDKLEAHYGQRPIIYTAPDFYRDNLAGHFPNHPFWLRSVAAHPSKVYPGRDFAFWQYSGTGLASTHSTQIDLNVFNGTEEAWQRWLKKHQL